MSADMILFVAVCGLVLVGIGQCFVTHAALKARYRAERQRATAERLLSYRRPMGDVTVRMNAPTQPLAGLHRRTGVGR